MASEEAVVAVRGAIRRLQASTRVPAPREVDTMLEFWHERDAPVRELAEAMGAPYVSRRADPAGWTRYRTMRRSIERWFAGAGWSGAGEQRTPRRLLGRLREVTAREWQKEHRGATIEEVLRGLLERGAIVAYAGVVLISKDRPFKDYVADIPAGEPIAGFVEEALAGAWFEATDELADAWRRYLRVGEIPAFLTWEEPESIDIQYGTSEEESEAA